jgi:predicted RNA-binding protein with PUA-like domain
MKSEPQTYSIEDLKADGSTCWDGVRNYQARNFMRDDMRVGDLILYYHSNAKPPGVAGIARVAREAYADDSAFDPKDKHHDPKSDPDEPTWMMVDVAFEEQFPEVVALDVLKADGALEGMLVVRRGMRLSVQPVEKAHFERVRKLGRSG